MEFRYKNTALIGDNDIEKEAGQLRDYLDSLNNVVGKSGYETPESFINLPFDSGMQNKVKEAADKLKSDKLKYIVVVGIGGSNLGTVAVYEAIYGKLDALKERWPKILFADTSDSALIHNIQEILQDVNSSEEIVINVISKSGSTAETIINFEVLYNVLKEKIDDIKERIVVTTDRDSKLWNLAEEKEFNLLEVPKNIIGRYSVLSAVGLFPLSVSGIDINSLLDGAKEVRDKCLSDALENPALVSSVLLYLHAKNGKTINDNFYFVPDFESLGKWYRQLMAESIGKTADYGITPTVSIGSADLHSMVQLYLGGPKDKFFNFISISKSQFKITTPKDLLFPGLVKGIVEKELSEIMAAISEGVKRAFQKREIPFADVVLEDISTRSIGKYLQWKMIEIVFLAKLLGVNAYDQPNVEEYKEETRKILESK